MGGRVVDALRCLTPHSQPHGQGVLLQHLGVPSFPQQGKGHWIPNTVHKGFLVPLQDGYCAATPAAAAAALGGGWDHLHVAMAGRHQ